MSISIWTIVTGIIGIIISVFTSFLAYKVQQMDKEAALYRKEREQKEQQEAENQRIREQAIDSLTLGMARTMLLNNYQACVNKGYYSVDQREVFHELYEAYRNDSGNGIIEQIAHKIVQLPTEPPKE